MVCLASSVALVKEGGECVPFGWRAAGSNTPPFPMVPPFDGASLKDLERWA